MKKNDHKDMIIWLALTTLAAFILLFISPDSYLNDLHSRVDSAWFFMCGKAWMNGLVPYVDFSDSKGPLLWLIYGMGYLLSHTNYVGVYWISCLWYGLTYFFTYKTARIFLPETGKAVLCTILMSLAFFNPWFHNEIRAEDYCLLFIVLSLYEVCRLVWDDQPDHKRIYLILGCCFSALLLIKFNIAAMQAVIILAALLVSLKSTSFWKNIAFCILGGAAAALPFLICFIIQGNLTAFFQEYFFRTWETASISAVHNDFTILQRFILYLREWYCVLAEPQIGALLLFLILGGALFAQQIDSHRYMILIVSLLVFALNIRHHILYYFTICSPFLLFLIISLCKQIPLERRWLRITVPSVAICFCIVSHILLVNNKTFLFPDSPARQGYQKIASAISQVKHPKIVNAFDHEMGVGTQGEALPAGKYWARQNGSTEQMDVEHKALILSGKADFVYVREPSFAEEHGLTFEDIENAGYHIICIGGESQESVLFAKKPIN